MKVDISIKEILVYVLRRWKIIVAVALVLSVGVGLAGYIKQAPNVPDATPDLTETPGLNETLDSSDDHVSDVNGTVKLSLGIDLTNFVATSADSYHITLVTNDLLTKIVGRYLLIAQGTRFSEVLKNILPSSFLEGARHDNNTVESPMVGIINISVSGVSGIDPNEVASAIYDDLLSYNGVIGESVAEHSLTLIASSYTESSPAKGDTLSDSVAADVSSPIISALVAFLAGLVVAALAAAVYYLIRLPIQVPDQVQQQLGIRYIGGLRKKRILSLGDRLAGSLRMAEDGEAISMIYANLKSFIGDHSRILVTGSIDEKSVKEFAEKIALVNDRAGIVFSPGADINKSASGVSALMDSDAVVLVESLDKSKLRHIKEEKDRIDMSGKDIIGYVLY